MSTERTYTIAVTITRRPSILDPEGKAVEHALAALAMPGIENVRIGKYIQLVVRSSTESTAVGIVQKACRKLLANPVIEDFHIEVLEEVL